MALSLQSPIAASAWRSLVWEEQEAKSPGQKEQPGNVLVGPCFSETGGDPVHIDSWEGLI